MNEARATLQSALDQLDTSISGQGNFSQQLVRDLKQCIANMDPASYQHVGSKYMYSLSRSLYTQRSSGISTGAAAAFATSAQRDMIQQMKGGNPRPAASSPSTSSFSSAPSSSSSSSAAPLQSKAASRTQSQQPQVQQKPATAASSSSQSSTQAKVAPGPVHSQETIARAVKRLLADLDEVIHSPLASVVALPMDDDMFEWHCSIRGPAGSLYAGVIFHVILQFPENYPFKPPTLHFCSFIEHPHVFGNYVCLDMLQEAQFGSAEETNKPYTGWSSAYSVQSILLQLQAFLFDEAKSDRAAVQKATLSAQRFKCDTCGHCNSSCFPAMKPVKKEVSCGSYGAGISKTNAVIPLRRLARPSTYPARPPPREQKVKPMPSESLKSSSSSTSVIEVAQKITEAAKIVVEKPRAPVAVEEAWTVIISKKSRQLQKRIEELGYDPRLRAKLAGEKARVAQAARKSRRSRPEAAQEEFIVEDEPNIPKAPRVIVGGELLRSKVPPVSVAPLAPISQLSKEEKRRKRNQAKTLARAAKRKAAHEKPAAPEPSTTSTQVSEPQAEATAPPSTVAVKKPTSASSKMQTAPATAAVASAFEKELLALASSKNATGMDVSLFGFLSDELIYGIFSYLIPVELNDIGVVCKDFLRLSGDRRLWRGLFLQRYRAVLKIGSEYTKYSVPDWKLLFSQENVLGRAGLQCFHSKADFRDTVLGVPIVVDRQPRFDNLQSPFEFLSQESFNAAKVRKSVWGLPFTHWLPLYIDTDHGERAWPQIEASIASLSFRTGGLRFEPTMALTILPRLMNSLVVSVMKGDLHASIKALEGYCGFHRLLLAFVQRYPRLLREINKKAKEFMSFERCRSKENTPNLGEFLPLLSVATAVNWKDIAIPYLQENFDRNALWAIKKYPGLAKPSQTERSGGCDQGRLTKTFDATKVSMHLLCFHVYFYQLSRPDGVSIDELAANYDAFFGVPSTQMKEALQAKVMEVLKDVTDWQKFFSAIGMKYPGDTVTHNWLLQAVENSSRKGYHSGPARSA